MVKKIISFFGLLFFPLLAGAQVPFDFSRFKDQTTFTVTGIKTPKVVLFESPAPLFEPIALQDARGDFIKYRLSTVNIDNNINFTVTTSSRMTRKSLSALADNNLNTSTTFNSGSIYTPLTLSFPKLTRINSLSTNLASDSIPPKRLTVETMIDGRRLRIINNEPFRTNFTFPALDVNQLSITYEAPNLLRINEIRLGNKDIKTKTELRFFAQEGGTYRLWSNPQFGQASPPTPKNLVPLNTDDKTPRFKLPNTTKNAAYNDDFDGDLIADALDLCPRTADSQNTDQDKNGRGDVCEDPDQDGKISAIDNCPFIYNPQQLDIDADSIGDKCDTTEDRTTEQSDWWINLSFGLMILALFFLVGRSILQHRKL